MPRRNSRPRFPAGAPRAVPAVCAAALLCSGAAGAEPAPIKIAVFDFELDDSSAGAGLSRTPDAIVWSTSQAPQGRV